MTTPITTTVADLNDEKQILVARALRWADENHETLKAEQALTALGLGDYMPAQTRPYTLDLSELRDCIPDHAEFTLSDPMLPHDTAYKVRCFLDDNVIRFMNRIRDGSITPEPVAHQPEQVDVEAVLDRWGAIGTAYPTTDRPEIEEYRQTTIRALLRFGDDQGYCSGLEDCIRAIGLGDYLPPQEKTTAVTIPADMSPLEITMPLNRTGEIRRADYLRTVARALTRALTARSDFTTPSEVTD